MRQRWGNVLVRAWLLSLVCEARARQFNGAGDQGWSRPKWAMGNGDKVRANRAR